MNFLRRLDLECLDEEPTPPSGGPTQDSAPALTEMTSDTPPAGSLSDQASVG
jgi:hypothetical protein